MIEQEYVDSNQEDCLFHGKARIDEDILIVTQEEIMIVKLTKKRSDG